MAGTVTLRTRSRVDRAPLVGLAVGLALLGLLFHEEVAAAIHVWINSTAYNHCFLVIPIAAYLAWDRRMSLAGVPVRPLPWIGAAALAFSVAWLAADRLGIMEGRQLVLMCIVEALFLAVLGWRMFLALLAPLLYLFFLVPFGGFLVPALQTFTARFINAGLALTSIPYFIDSYVIQIPEGTFFVAEACAGLRFLIASVAFGVLYSVLIFRSWTRRAVFIAASIVVPIIANGFRALGIVLLGHFLGSAEAAVADHLIYGWVFFSVVTILLVLAGLPFRQDGARPAVASYAVAPYARARAVRDEPMRREIIGHAPLAGQRLRGALAAAGLTAVFAALGPAVAGWLNHAAAGERLAVAPLVVPGCVPAPLPDGAPSVPGIVQQHYACRGDGIALQVAVLPPRTGPSRVLAAQRVMAGLASGAEVGVSRLDVPGSAVPWRLALADEPPPFAAAFALWIDGAPTAGGLQTRLRQAVNSVRGGEPAPVIVAATVDPRTAPIGAPVGWMQARLRDFLAGRPDLPAAIARLSADAVRPH